MRLLTCLGFLNGFTLFFLTDFVRADAGVVEEPDQGAMLATARGLAKPFQTPIIGEMRGLLGKP